MPEKWTEDGNQDVMGARLQHRASVDDYEQGNWKLNDEQTTDGYEDHKLHPSDSPTGASNA